MTSTIKVNNIQNQCGANIANKCGSTVTLGASGDTITLACGASQTGFGRTGTVDWDTTAKTASFTAVSGNGYFVNTTSGAITVTLPAGSAGDIVSLADYTNTWQTNNVTITPNGSDKIGGVNADATLNTEGQSVTFVYVDGTEGWKNVQDSTSNTIGNAFIVATGGTVTTCGNCKIHTFTGPGTFCVSTAALCAANNVVSYLVVAGGGGGGSNRGGGAGAGGFRELKSPTTSYTASPLDGYPTPGNRITVTATSFPITVGGGGGNNSIFSSITSAGGGEGGPASGPGCSGGSGGGGGHSPSGHPGGAGNTPPVSPPQGNPGGIGQGPAPGNGGGGGGATASGGNAPGGGVAGNGGAGATTSISGSPTAYAGGGGGGSYQLGGTSTVSSGGIGGGGSGGTGTNCAVNATAGSANTGGGGGGGSSPGGNAGGGSGIVIIRYKYQ